MRKAFAFWLAAMVLAAFGVGCSTDKEKGINSGHDKPKSTKKDS